jgi:hypothetical protein
MRQQALLGLNRVDLTKPLLRKPKPPANIPKRMQIGPQMLPNDRIDLAPITVHQDNPIQRRRHRTKWTLQAGPTVPVAVTLGQSLPHLFNSRDNAIHPQGICGLGNTKGKGQ